MIFKQILSCFCLFWISHCMYAGDAQALLAQLGQFQTLTAHFTQTAYGAHQRIVAKNTGTMALERPDKFRWESYAPNQQLFIADGHHVWIYDVDLAQVTQKKQGGQNNPGAFVLLASSQASLLKRFVVKEMGEGTFQLTPKGKQAFFQWMQLHLNRGKLVSMRIQDATGVRSVFYFHKIKVNPNLPAATFRFHVPKGVDVIKDN